MTGFVLVVMGITGTILFVQWWNATLAAERLAAEAQAEKEKREEDEHDFWESAKPARAKVLSAYQFGRLNLRPEMHITLRIESDDETYEVEVTKAMQAMYMHRITPGSLVNVWINPSQRDHVVLDFDEVPTDDETKD